jgi:hypothetical protein
VAELARLLIAGFGRERIRPFQTSFLVPDAPLRREIAVFTCHPDAYELHLTATVVEAADPSFSMAEHDPP